MAETKLRHLLSTFLVRRTSTENNGNEASHISSISALSSETSYIVARSDHHPSGAVFGTSDGGDTWHKVDLSIEEEMLPTVIQWENTNIGWIGGTIRNKGGSLVLGTINAGKKWEIQLRREINGPCLPPFCGVPYSIDIADRLCASLSDAGDYYHVTLDGGNAWTTYLLPMDPSFLYVKNIRMVNRTLAFLVSGTQGVLVSQNSGQAWNTLHTGYEEKINDCYAMGDGQVWAVGYDGLILKSENFGNSWVKQCSHTDLDINSIEMINDTTGWIAGDDGLIMSTEDGGNEWQVTGTSNISQHIVRLCAIDQNVIWAIAENGIVLVTTDGGKEWQWKRVRLPTEA